MIKIDCVHSPENHIGLGSGTQLILSVEELITKFYKLDIIQIYSIGNLDLV